MLVTLAGRIKMKADSEIIQPSFSMKIIIMLITLLLRESSLWINLKLTEYKHRIESIEVLMWIDWMTMLKNLVSRDNPNRTLEYYLITFG